VGVDPIDFYFFKDGEGRIEFAFCKLAYISIRSIFLIVELVDRKGQDLEIFTAELVIHFSQGFVVFVGERTLGGHIDDKKGFFASECREVNIVSIDVVCSQIEERFHLHVI